MNLRIVSQMPDSRGRRLQQYNVDGVKTVGVVGQEPFWIEIENISSKRAQLTVAVDGTNVSTGEKATLAGNGNWVVEPRRTMVLKAWPESQRGGAAFVFTHVDNSVALHTHAVLDAVGYISTAWWLEGYEPPVWRGRLESTARSGNDRGMLESFSLGEPKGGPAVGAGSYVDQRIEQVAGLIQPVYQGIVSVRYLWWDDLQTRLRELNVQPQHPTGFEPARMANLGSTPRLNTAREPVSVGYNRFE